MRGARIAVTGLGVVSPYGSVLEDYWSALRAGRSAVSELPDLPEDTPVRIGAPVRGFDVGDYLSPREARRYDAFIHYGAAAASLARESANLSQCEDRPERIGVLIGTGLGGVDFIEAGALTLKQSGARRVSPMLVPGSIANMVGGQVAMQFGYRGPNAAVVSACATGSHCIGLGARLIAAGDADVVLAGGSEMILSSLMLSTFANMKALSRRQTPPERASCPWDIERDGFVMGAGAAVLVLEDWAHAEARGAEIVAELSGFGLSADAHHITQPEEDGRGPSLAMAGALRDAGIEPSQIGYINAHGTSTPLGDIAELRAIRRVFGAAADDLCISSTKSMIGHTLGAAGAFEAVVCALSLRDQVVHPTLNLEQPDPDCDLDCVPGSERPVALECALSNSFGFGGTNASLVFRRPAG
ncbi:MAG: beta-ketoacyl-ACP synthase II [Gammaproteobacteria bacterium AqS3]|nr:beta-ketoacyl-ACP synthase II [Gammaproteobacteria bacterium AqS3]